MLGWYGGDALMSFKNGNYRFVRIKELDDAKVFPFLITCVSIKYDHFPSTLRLAAVR